MQVGGRVHSFAPAKPQRFTHLEITSFKGSIYADPDRNLFRLFDLAQSFDRTPAGDPKKSYLAGQTFLGNMFSSIWV